ncbi:hypothetical protein OHB35_15295 [Streptomyces phaeochromogenes]|uniref:Uncharacterized protein n=1 Tax=Streptomyces phaeochromogenes TaxID=1923 RepID=A0ABZ1HAX7_STRPH|nr:hypothetical protein [Streptomyces phaeochromogenes]WSD14496.1 hypothetical protein OHB35_15295 [Streptomyces phaeochromogenes]
MSVIDKPTNRDTALEEAFCASVAELYAQAAHLEVCAALHRALELRSLLAVAEEQVVCVRDRVHASMSADRDLGELSAEDLRWDAQWLEAALAGRDGYVAALDDLLRTMPSPDQRPPQPVQFAQPKITATAPPAPATGRAGAVRTHRP